MKNSTNHNYHFCLDKRGAVQVDRNKREKELEELALGYPKEELVEHGKNRLKNENEWRENE